MAKTTDGKKKRKSRLKKLRKQWLDLFGYKTSYQAIHRYCISCCGGNRKGPTVCEDWTCLLWPWRTGHSEISKSKRIFHKNSETGKFHAVPTVRKKKLKGILSIAERKGKTVITIEQKGENEKESE